MSAVVRRLAAGAAVLVLAATSAGCGQQDEPRQARSVEPVADDRVGGVGDWLADQLVDGVVQDAQLGAPDVDLTIDVGVALAALGGHDDDLAALTARVVDERDEHAGVDGDLVPATAARTLVFLQSQDADTGELAAEVEAAIGRTGVSTGRLLGSSDGRYSDVVGQAYAARGLVDAGADQAGRATRYLLAQQCESGWFRSTFSAPSSPTPACDDVANSEPDVEATAVTILVLGPVADEVPGAQPALDAAADWLTVQLVEEGIPAADGARGSSAALTGLAGWALGSWGEEGGAADAAEALVPLQLERGTDAGAIAPDLDTLPAGQPRGLGVPVPPTWQRSTAAAAPALEWLDD